MSTTIKTTKTGRHACGFCQSGDHRHCPGGVLNGNGTEVVVCPCDCETPKVRCLDCGARVEISDATWTCEDAEACHARRAARREQVSRELYGDGPTPESLKARQVKEDRKMAPAKAKTPRQCLCCGETTGGGLFRPGHDSRYLSSHVTAIREGKTDLESTLRMWEKNGISEALQAKLEKRVSA